MLKYEEKGFRINKVLIFQGHVEIWRERSQNKQSLNISGAHWNMKRKVSGAHWNMKRKVSGVHWNMKRKFQKKGLPEGYCGPSSGSPLQLLYHHEKRPFLHPTDSIMHSVICWKLLKYHFIFWGTWKVRKCFRTDWVCNMLQQTSLCLWSLPHHSFITSVSTATTCQQQRYSATLSLLTNQALVASTVSAQEQFWEKLKLTKDAALGNFVSCKTDNTLPITSLDILQAGKGLINEIWACWPNS